MAEEVHVTETSTWPRTIAIIGCGTMGLGVAESFIRAGRLVRLHDRTPELTRAAHARLVHRVRAHVAAGLLDQAVIERAVAVEVGDTLAAAVHAVDLVFEAVPEQPALKHAVLAASAAAAPAAAILATNTSSIPIDELAGAIPRPAQFLGMHWFNPPEWTPGIELIPGTATDPAVLARVRLFLHRIGKRPVVVGSSPGFVANRLQFALFREAVACVEEGLATPADVDAAVRSCFGFRLPLFGPFQIADMAGLDVYANVFATLERGLGTRFHVPDLLTQLLEQGRIGTKAGAGFFTYTPEERDQLLRARDRAYAALGRLIAELQPEDGDLPA